MKYSAYLTTCDCHPETCSHWNYYIENSDGDTVDGADTLREVKEKCDKLNKGTND